MALRDWRRRLAEAFAKEHTFASGEELAEAVQRVLDRLIFIRVCEDRLQFRTEIDFSASLVDVERLDSHAVARQD